MYGGGIIKNLAELWRNYIHANERQKVAIEYFKIHQKISRSQYAKLTNCSLRTAFRDLEKLLKDNILIRKGVGRNIYYELARKWHANGTVNNFEINDPKKISMSQYLSRFCRDLKKIVIFDA